MITGDNPLTACHVAREVNIVDRDILVLDLRENPKNNRGGCIVIYDSIIIMPYLSVLVDPLDFVWKSIDEKTVIPVDPEKHFDPQIFRNYDICITGAALSQYADKSTLRELLNHTWVYARVSPSQKVIMSVIVRRRLITIITVIFPKITGVHSD
jgi:cation-transporting ATPase 13A1